MRKICGVAVNDEKGSSSSYCYKIWMAMIFRCYDQKCQESSPSYKDCSVCSEWLVYSNFKKWMEAQCYKGKHLDKDILFEGNKLYSPETCVFVDRSTNALLTDHAAKRGEWPQGVSFHKSNGMFVARCRENGSRKNIGSFLNPEDAEKAYLKYKSKVVADCANRQPHISVMNALLDRSKSMLEMSI